MSLSNTPKRVLFDMSDINQYQYIDLAPFNAIYTGTDDTDDNNYCVYAIKYGNNNANDDNYNQETLLFDFSSFSPFNLMIEHGYLPANILNGFDDSKVYQLCQICADKLAKKLVNFIRTPYKEIPKGKDDFEQLLLESFANRVPNDELILTQEWLIKNIINPSINQMKNSTIKEG